MARKTNFGIPRKMGGSTKFNMLAKTNNAKRLPYIRLYALDFIVSLRSKNYTSPET
jgi:hypothetical protein